MTLLVVTAQGDSPDELYANARAAAASAADWVEVRLDGPSGLPWDLRPWFAGIEKPTLATVRAREDGGRSNADDEARAGLLKRALLAGAHAIDVEFSSEAAKSLLDEAHARVAAKVVISLHDLDGTPEDILGTLRKMRALGADYAKIATTIRAPTDAARLVDAARAAQREGIPFALMGVNDPLLRLAAPTLGMSLVYGSAPGQPPAAPGQVPVDQLQRAHAGAPARLAFLLGHPVAHSKSPAMQDAAFAAAGIAGARYLAADITDLPAAVGVLRALQPLGANVTVPHKESVLPLLDALAPSAKSAGAANTLQFHDGKITGHNTDGAGALDALREAGCEPKGKDALVLGAGGTGRAIARALVDAGASQVSLTNRTFARAQDVARAVGADALAWDESAWALDQFEVVVHATTVGLESEALPFPAEQLGADVTLLDCVYGDTPLTRAARARGLRVVRGEEMLVHQGARAFEIWTGRAPDITAMRGALE